MPTFAHVALPLPVFEPYTYRVPDSLADRVRPGARVIVPVRKKELVGIVTAADVTAPAVAARDVLAAPDPEPALDPGLLETADWIGRYYGAAPGLALRSVLPAGLWGQSVVRLVVQEPVEVGGVAGELLSWLVGRGGEGTIPAAARALRRPVWDAADRLARVGAVAMAVESPRASPPASHERMIVLAGEPMTLLDRDARFARRPRQRALYEALEQGGGSAAASHLRDRLGFADGLVRALVAEGLARVELVEVMRDPFAGLPVSPPPGPPSPAQRDAIAAIGAMPPGDGALLVGVTGSGKTLVYLELIRAAIDQGRGAILLVPEIGLTPQTVSRVRGMFGDQVAVLHSGLSDGERADAWLALRRGERMVAVGARSAVFAPVRNLGLIVVDEEHESSYKNGEVPRYHAREVAMVRARIAGARLVLGSATPSLESVERLGSRLGRVDLPSRIHARPLPPVQLVDLRSAPLVRGTAGVPWSEALDEAVATTLAQGDQILLLLNRRGYASFMQCRSCGHVPECPRCSISLTVHRAPSGLRCHYCDFHQAIPPACGECGHRIQSVRGVGTQQLERLMSERFPAARLARMDLDTTQTKWAHHRILGAVARREVDVLVGTQMIAKGIDLPEVTLVGVVDADLALHLPDFRAAERTFQLLTQVAGRAGRGDRAGRVVVQTRQPGHHALVHSARHDVVGFQAEELALRRDPPYPPHLSLVNLVVSGGAEREVQARSAALADWCGELAGRHRLELTVLGPAPCPIARIKDRWRWHVVLKGSGEVIGKVVRALAPRIHAEPGVRIALDRDPVSML